MYESLGSYRNKKRTGGRWVLAVVQTGVHPLHKRLSRQVRMTRTIQDT
jgi:hypothetical protein